MQSRTARTLVMMLLSAGLAQGVLAQAPAVKSPQPAPAPHSEPAASFRRAANAADEFWRAWALEPRALLDAMTAENAYNDRHEPSPQLADMLRTMKGHLDWLELAAGIEQCDFGLVSERGPMLSLPHLAKLRLSSRMLRIDAERLKAEGDFEGAARRIRAIVQISRHLSGEPYLISGLVAQAAAELAFASVEVAPKEGDAEWRSIAARTLRPELAKMDAKDPFGIKRAFAGEGNFIGAWMKENFKGKEAGKALVATGMIDPVAQGVAAEDMAAIALLDETLLGEQVDKLLACYRDSVAAFDAGNDGAGLVEVRARVEDGGYGLLARAFAPPVSNVWNAYQRGLRRYAEFSALLGKAPVAPGSPI